jgi:hypothetical protein
LVTEPAETPVIWQLLQEGLTTYLSNPVLLQSIFKLSKGVENEVVPETERGKYIIGTFHDFECYPDERCGGNAGGLDEGCNLHKRWRDWGEVRGD